jgi:lysophospholipase L1-like esterase
VNFACAGATTTSILTRRGCTARARAIGSPRYRTTQIGAAERFLRAHRGDVALITVSIGGNDVGRCANAVAPIDCLSMSVTTMRRNATTIAKRLRKAAGRAPRITGITYPDVLLEKWLRSNAGKLVASLSVAAFRQVINPALKDAYRAGKGVLADVTAATGAYGRFDRMTTTRAHGRIPVPVAKVCKYTHICRYGDIHANRAGHAVIARLVARTLRRR